MEKIGLIQNDKTIQSYLQKVSSGIAYYKSYTKQGDVMFKVPVSECEIELKSTMRAKQLIKYIVDE